MDKGVYVLTSNIAGVVVKEEWANKLRTHIDKDISCYEIGKITNGDSLEKVSFSNRIVWD